VLGLDVMAILAERAAKIRGGLALGGAGKGMFSGKKLGDVGTGKGSGVAAAALARINPKALLPSDKLNKLLTEGIAMKVRQFKGTKPSKLIVMSSKRLMKEASSSEGR